MMITTGMRNKNACRVPFGDLCVGGEELPVHIDGVCERNGHFLLMEWQKEGEIVPEERRALLKELARVPKFTVLVVNGQTKGEDVEVEAFYLLGKDGGEKRGEGLGSFISYYRKWFNHADSRKKTVFDKTNAKRESFVFQDKIDGHEMVKDHTATHIDYAFLSGKIESIPKFMPSDLDGVAMRNGKFLVIEWKKNGEGMSQGQLRTLLAMKNLEGGKFFDVVVVTGETDGVHLDVTGAGVMPNGCDSGDLYKKRSGIVEPVMVNSTEALRGWFQAWKEERGGVKDKETRLPRGVARNAGVGKVRKAETREK